MLKNVKAKVNCPRCSEAEMDTELWADESGPRTSIRANICQKCEFSICCVLEFMGDLFEDRCGALGTLFEVPSRADLRKRGYRFVKKFSLYDN